MDVPLFVVNTKFVLTNPSISYTLFPNVVELLKNLTVYPPPIVIVAL